MIRCEGVRWDGKVAESVKVAKLVERWSGGKDGKVVNRLRLVKR